MIYVMVDLLNKEKRTNRSFEREMSVLQSQIQDAPRGTSSKNMMKYKVEQDQVETSKFKRPSLLPEMRKVPSTVLIPRMKVNKSVMALEDIALISMGIGDQQFFIFLGVCECSLYNIDICLHPFSFLVIVPPKLGPLRPQAGTTFP